jgi:hypothetical protein
MTLTRGDKIEGEPDRSIGVTTRVLRTEVDGVAFAFVLPASMQVVDAQTDFRTEADRKTLQKFITRLIDDSANQQSATL